MGRSVIVNLFLAVLVAGLVGAVIVLETSGETAATTTTTTTTVPPTTTTTTTTTTTSTTTTTTTTTSTTTIPPTTLPPPDRLLVDVVVVNGTAAGERLEPTIDRLREAGYVQLRGLTGAVQASESVVYFLDETFRGAAEVLALDVGLSVEDIALFEDAPPVAGRGTAQMMLYLGGD